LQSYASIRWTARNDIYAHARAPDRAVRRFKYRRPDVSGQAPSTGG